MNNTVSRTNNFDLVRLFAALKVVVIHGYEHLHLKEQYEVLDLIFNSFSRNSNLKRYCRNRFLRLYPGLWGSFIITFSILILLGFINLETILSPGIMAWIAGQLTFLQFYTPDVLRGYGLGNPNGSLWTIAVEIQYYIFVPLILIIVKRIKVNMNLILVALIVISIGANYYINNYFVGESLPVKLARLSLAPYLFYFLMGAFVSANYQRLIRFFENKALTSSIVYLSFCIVFSGILEWYLPSYWPIFWGLISVFLLIWCMFSIAFSNRELSKKILKETDISYGVYIYHMIVLNLFLQKVEGNSIVLLLIYFVLSILLGLGSWKLIEAPFLKSKRVVTPS